MYISRGTRTMLSPNDVHVVYGSGPVGTAVVEMLLERGQRVRVVTHSGKRRHLPPQVEVVAGDATDGADAQRVCADATHVYNCTNPPDYHRWPTQFPPLQRGVLEGAAASSAKLIVMENLYLYGPHGGVPMTEAMPQRGQGSRSTTRIAMAQELMEAHRSGKVRAVSARAADLFGPHVAESLVGARLFGPALAGTKVPLLANPDLPHSLTYIRDVGRAMVTLGEDDRALGQAWHVPNAPVVTLRQFVRLMLPLMGLFVPSLRGLEENIYIAYEPYIVDHNKYAQMFGDHATPLHEAIGETVRWYQAHSAQQERHTAPNATIAP